MNKKNIFSVAFLAIFSAVLFFPVKSFAADCCIKNNTCVSISKNVTQAYCISSTYGGKIIDCSTNTLCQNSTASTSTTTATPSTAGSTTTFPNPIGFSTVADLLNALLDNLMGIIAFIAVIFIVIGGIMYMSSAGDEKRVTKAKSIWTGAVIGLAIALAAPTFLKEIQFVLGGGGTTGGAENWVANAPTIQGIATRVLDLLFSIFGFIAIIALVIGGGMYLTAYGDEKKIDDGKKMIKYAIIGIVVALSAMLIVRQVNNLLKGGTASATSPTSVVK